VAEEAIRRFGGLYAVERELVGPSDDERRCRRWAQLKARLALERRRVADRRSTAAAIDYTLNHWKVLAQHLDDGAGPIDTATWNDR